jgi:histidine ammonia-lyase
MGTNSALIAKTVIENAFQVISIHFMALAQATDCLKFEEKLSSQTQSFYKEIRKCFPVLIEDRTLYQDIEKVVELLKNYK